MKQFKFIKENTIHILLVFFIFIFVVSVVLSSILLLKQNSIEVNVIEEESYDRVMALENNGGSTTFMVQINPIVEAPESSNNTNTPDIPAFPEVTPSQNYVIPQTGVFNNQIILFGIIYSFPSLIAWLLFRRFVVNKI